MCVSAVFENKFLRHVTIPATEVEFRTEVYGVCLSETLDTYGFKIKGHAREHSLRRPDILLQKF